MKELFRPERSLAMVIGAGARFEADRLMEQTVDDAHFMAKELTLLSGIPKRCIKTLCGHNASSDILLSELDRIAAETLPDPLEMFIFYFSGHGAVSKGNYYLVCNNNDGKSLDNGTVSSEILTKKLQEINTVRMVVLLDCCHAEGMTATDENPVDEEVLMMKKPNRVVLSASHYGEVSFLSRPVSVFTYALLEGLSGKYLSLNDKYVNVFDLALYVRERVSALSRQKQKPQFNVLQNNLTANFALAYFPEGRPDTPVFDSAFSLLTIDGKNIDTEGNYEHDREFAVGIEWIRSNTESGENPEMIVSVKGDSRSLSVNLLNIDSLVSKMDEAAELRKDLLAETDGTRKKPKSRRLERIMKEVNAQRENIIALAKTFCEIEISTERMRIAYEEFLRGNTETVDRILDLDSLNREQNEIIESAQIINEQKKTSDERLLLNSNEFLLKASNTLLLENVADRYKTAEDLFRKSLASFRNTVNLFAFGSFMLNQNRFREAAELFSECITAYSNAPGDRSRFRSDVASAYQNLGYCLEQLNDPVPAGECYRNAVIILEQMKAEGINTDDELSAAYSNIANYFMAVQDFRNAEQYLLKSLQIKKKLSETNEPSHMQALAAGFLNMGKYFSDKGEYMNAYNSNSTAVSIIDGLRKELPGRYDSDYARAVSNIAQILANMNQPEVAREAFEDAVQFRRILYGRNPSGFGADLSNTLNGYGLFEYKQRNFDKAERLLKEALMLREELAEEMPESFEDEFAESLENYAMLLLNTEGAEAAAPRLNEAEEILSRLQKKMPKAFGLRIAQLKFHKGLMNYVGGRISDSEKLCNEALGIAKEFPTSVRADQLIKSIQNFISSMNNESGSTTKRT